MTQMVAAAVSSGQGWCAFSSWDDCCSLVPMSYSPSRQQAQPVLVQEEQQAGDLSRSNQRPAFYNFQTQQPNSLELPEVPEISGNGTFPLISPCVSAPADASADQELVDWLGYINGDETVNNNNNKGQVLLPLQQQPETQFTVGVAAQASSSSTTTTTNAPFHPVFSQQHQPVSQLSFSAAATTTKAVPPTIKQEKPEFPSQSRITELRNRARSMDSGTVSRRGLARHDSGLTALEIFMSFVTRDPTTGELDCSQVIGRECYELWLATRAGPSAPEECFRKSLIAHVTVSDGGSQAFQPEVEAALLKMLRKGRIWPCFEGRKFKDTGKAINIGKKGLRSLGYHEKKELERLGIKPTSKNKRKSTTSGPPQRKKLMKADTI